MCVEGGGGIAERIGGVTVAEEQLPERRHLVSPGAPTIERPGVGTVVEADAAVVVADDQVVGGNGVDGDHLFSLPAK